MSQSNFCIVEMHCSQCSLSAQETPPDSPQDSQGAIPAARLLVGGRQLLPVLRSSIFRISGRSNSSDWIYQLKVSKKLMIWETENTMDAHTCSVFLFSYYFYLRSIYWNSVIYCCYNRLLKTLWFKATKIIILSFWCLNQVSLGFGRAVFS